MFDLDTRLLRAFVTVADELNFTRAGRRAARGGPPRGECDADEDHGNAESVYFRDPDGHAVELTTYR